MLIFLIVFDLPSAIFLVDFCLWMRQRAAFYSTGKTHVLRALFFWAPGKPILSRTR
jgi:hypothetical protein